MEDNKDFIYMYAAAACGESDWYGDFNYKPTDLDCFKFKSKLWEYKIPEDSCSHGYGCPGVAVKTTMEALRLLGWESLYDEYKTTEEKYNKIKE